MRPMRKQKLGTGAEVTQEFSGQNEGVGKENVLLKNTAICERFTGFVGQ